MFYLFLLAFAVGFAFDILAIIAVRVLARFQAQAFSGKGVYLSVLSEIVMVLTLLLLPVIAAASLSEDKQELRFVLIAASPTNLLSAGFSMVVLVGAMSLLFNKVFWPFLARPLYRLGVIGVFKSFTSRAVLFSVGVAAIGVSVGYGGDVVATIKHLFTTA
jgi:hypothetical protein